MEVCMLGNTSRDLFEPLMQISDLAYNEGQFGLGTSERKLELQSGIQGMKTQHDLT